MGTGVIVFISGNCDLFFDIDTNSSEIIIAPIAKQRDQQSLSAE